jgi:hypothetical protein
VTHSLPLLEISHNRQKDFLGQLSPAIKKKRKMMRMAMKEIREEEHDSENSESFNSIKNQKKLKKNASFRRSSANNINASPTQNQVIKLMKMSSSSEESSVNDQICRQSLNSMMSPIAIGRFDGDESPLENSPKRMKRKSDLNMNKVVKR